MKEKWDYTKKESERGLQKEGKRGGSTERMKEKQGHRKKREGFMCERERRG